MPQVIPGGQLGEAAAVGGLGVGIEVPAADRRVERGRVQPGRDRVQVIPQRTAASTEARSSTDAFPARPKS